MTALSPGPQLALAAALCTGALAGLHQFANPLIKAGEQRARDRALQSFARPGEQLVATGESWQLRDGETVQALILPASAADGYSGTIELLVGVGADGRSRGLRVTAHRETPGLGDGIEPGQAWSRQFDGRPITPDWALRRDGGEIDHLTGATISARAVVRAAASVIAGWRKAAEQAPSGADR